MTRQRVPPGHAAGILAVAALGLADDVTGHVPARVRLAGQLLIGASAFGRGGWDRAVSSTVTASVVNVVNFMDGINGISGLTAIVWGLNAMLLQDENGGQLAALGAFTAGAGLGFLPHNAPAAQLFLGDVGSYAMGTAMASGILSQRTLGSRYRVAAPLLLYGADAAQALAQRTRKGQRLGEAHRDHVYQRLVDDGQPHIRVALVHAVAAAGLAWLSRSRSWGLSGSLVVCSAYLALPEIVASLSKARGSRRLEGRLT